MASLPKGYQQIEDAQPGYGTSEPGRRNRRTDDRKSGLISQERKQIIIAPVAYHAETDPRQKCQIKAQKKAEKNKENDGQFFNHTVKV